MLPYCCEKKEKAIIGPALGLIIITVNYEICFYFMSAIIFFNEIWPNFAT
jgi:hypothetical protein